MGDHPELTGAEIDFAQFLEEDSFSDVLGGIERDMDIQRAFTTIEQNELRGSKTESVLKIVKLLEEKDQLKEQLEELEELEKEVEKDNLEMPASLKKALDQHRTGLQKIEEALAKYKESPIFKAILDVSSMVRIAIDDILYAEGEIHEALGVDPYLDGDLLGNIHPRSRAHLVEHYEGLADSYQQKENEGGKAVFDEMAQLVGDIYVDTQSAPSRYATWQQLQCVCAAEAEGDGFEMAEKLKRLREKFSPENERKKAEEDLKTITALLDDCIAFNSEPEPTFHAVRKSKNGPWNEWNKKWHDITDRIFEYGKDPTIGIGPIWDKNLDSEVLAKTKSLIEEVLAVYKLFEKLNESDFMDTVAKKLAYRQAVQLLKVDPESEE